LPTRRAHFLASAGSSRKPLRTQSSPGYIPGFSQLKTHPVC
jgi:hypothetical protein